MSNQSPALEVRKADAWLDGGVLALDGAAPRDFQSGRLTLSLDVHPQSVDEGELEPLPDPAFNVGGIYAALRDDIVSENTTAPDFDHVVRLTRLTTDVSRSLATRAPVVKDRWPKIEEMDVVVVDAALANS